MILALVTIVASLGAFVLGVAKASRVDREFTASLLIGGLILFACWSILDVLDDMWLGDVALLLALVLISIGVGVMVGNRKRS